MSPAIAFARHLRHEVIRALRAIPQGDRADVYVIAIGLETEFPDERCVTAHVAWNTRAHLRARQAGLGPREQRGREWSRFGFAAPDAALIADTAGDPAGAQLLGRRTWSFPSWADRRLPRLAIEPEPQEAG
jgi:hypothetical protein